MTLLATGRWLHPGYQSHQMPLKSDVYRFMVPAYDLLLINQGSISGDELSTPWYGNTHIPSYKKKFLTVKSTKKILAIDFWDTTGILLDGCGLKLQRQDNQCHSLPQHSGWILRHCSKKQVGTVQHWYHPSGQWDTPHSPEDRWFKQYRWSVAASTTKSRCHTCEFHLIGPL